MKESILITGVAGSGKTTLSKKLKKEGYKTHDFEDGYDLFTMINKETGEVFEDYDNDDMEKVKKGKWVCDINKLKKLIERDDGGITFYCGIASNIEELIPLFDKVMLLKVSKEVVQKRLSARKSGDFGNTKEVQIHVLSWKDEWEKKMQKKGSLVLDADKSSEEVVNQIRHLIN